MKLPLLGALLALLACTAPAQQEKALGALQRLSGDEVTAETKITGHVRWMDKKAPRRRKLRMDSDPVCVELCQGAPMLDERAIVDDKMNFKNVVVYVSKGLPERKWKVPSEPVAIDQVQCRYVPHVLAFQLGQKLKIRSSDPTPHNVNFVSKLNGSWNVNMTRPGVIDPKEPFKSAEYERPTALLKCDIHPWMGARLFIFDHPFYAISGADGRFEIPLGDLPAGAYTLTAVHEKYRSASVDIQVEAGKATEVHFGFNKKKENVGEQKN